MNILLTGGHTGIGLELSKTLFAEGHTLGLIVRSKSRIEGMPKEIQNSDKLSVWEADLSDQQQVAGIAETISKEWSHIDVLYNNAGVLLDKLYTSKQGNEMHLEVNTLSPYLLTEKLKPLLDNAQNPVVVNTVTGGMHQRKSLKLEALVNPKEFKKLIGAYLQSKLALTLLTVDRSQAWTNIRFVNLDPGPNKTPMTAGVGMPKFLMPLRNLFFPPPTKGGSLLYKAVFDPQHQGKSGIYLSGNKDKPMSMALSSSDKQALLTGLKSQ
ncbi:MAG TPA: short-chain dehydrogenase [Cytophagales bacterium]|nr:short-chain dehydrogenase [Cytophagales bacterium]HAA21616.1 short-chain dehydrogenase [Cytophagales bacterium]HAP62843.1 short-chain dehydrogenase [Cytophagales bacterium]